MMSIHILNCKSNFMSSSHVPKLKPLNLTLQSDVDINDFEEIETAQEIVPGLYLGSLKTLSDSQWLKLHKITHNIDLSQSKCKVDPKIKQLHINILDKSDAKICDHFETTSDYIDEALQNGGKVLVNCLKGVSRSTTIVAAYIIRKYQVSHKTAIEMIRKRRKCVAPNIGFYLALRRWSA